MRIKRVASLLIGLTMVAGCVGCAVTTAKTNGTELTLWSESSTSKILQDDDGETAKNAGNKNILTVHMARNESEGVQLMLYAKKEIPSYKVTVSDLVYEDYMIASEDIAVYQIKYQESVNVGQEEAPAFSNGYVPDPMLPIETAMEYQENAIKQGNNQAIFLDVTTQASTPAGTYEGVVTVETEKTEYRMPMQVQVYDVTLPDCAELQSSFSYFDRDSFGSAELDATDEMAEIYFSTFLDYNMSGKLPFESGNLDEYMELLKKYYDHPGFTAYPIFADLTDSIYNGEEYGYNAKLYEDYIFAIGKMSVEDKKNYLSKAITRMSVVDEPRTEAQFLELKHHIDIYDDTLTTCDERLRSLYAGTDDYAYYVEHISETLLSIPYTMAGSYDMNDVNKYGLQDLTFTPLIDELHLESNRKSYTNGREDKEIWTYTCNYPTYPYPNGHTADYCLGFRLISWMCKDYDFGGFVMWGTANYLNFEWGDVVADPWTTMDTGFDATGEGKFFYPGAKYGLDAPCPSLRAVAWRDGVDDYSLLREIEKLYEEQGMDAQVALQEFYDTLYEGVIPITDSDLFEQVRGKVFELLENLQSNVGIFYQNITIELQTAEIAFKCANDEAKAKVNGKELQADKDGIYHVTIDLQKQTDFEVTISCGDEQKEYHRQLIAGTLGAVCGFEDVETVDDYISSFSKGYSAEVTSDEQYAYDGTQAVRMVINKDGEDTLPYFAITKDSKLIGGKWDNVVTMKFYIYNPSEEDVKMDVSYYTTKDTSLGAYTLVAGEWNLIELDMPQNLDDINAIEEFDFNFSQGSKVELYLDSFATVVEKGE